MTALRKVLLVSDDQVALNTLEKLFAAKNYAAETVTSGEDALWRFEDDDYDAVFTDLDLRGISGIEVAAAIHARQSAVPVVILAATAEKVDRERAEATGAAEFWLKSQPQKQLAAAVDRVLKAAASAAAGRPQKPKQPQTATILLERVRNVLLFIFAPFIALGYIIAFPLVGLGALIWFAFKAVRRAPAATMEAAEAPAAAVPGQGILKTGGMLIAAIVIGVAYGIVGPVFGILLVIYFAFEAWGRLGAKAIKAKET